VPARRVPINRSKRDCSRRPARWLHWAVLASAGLVLLPGAALANPPANATAQARVIVVKRLSFIKTADLDFGRIVPGNSAGTVTITPEGGMVVAGGARFSGDDGHPASFSGYGTTNQIVSIAVTRNSVLLTRVGGNETMRLETFVIGSTPQTQITTSPLAFRIASSTGMFAFPLGATLRVGARQKPGIYTGTFSLTLQYQ